MWSARVILLIGWWWGNWESASSTFWFQPAWGLYGADVLVGSTQLTSSSWWGLQNLENSSKDMTQNIMCSPWGGAKVLWIVSWLKFYYFLSCLTVFLSFGIFLTFLIKFFLWSFSTDKRQTEIVGGSLFWEGLEGSCSVAQVGKCSSWPKGRLWKLKDKWTLSSNPLTKLWCLCPFPLIWAGLMFTVI